MTTNSKTAGIPLAEFFEQREVGTARRQIVWIAIRPMTKDQARQAYLYRPSSKYAESRFGGDNLYDDVCLLLNSLAARCTMCQAPTKTDYLTEGCCPDCDGRSEFNGTSPHGAG